MLWDAQGGKEDCSIIWKQHQRVKRWRTWRPSVETQNTAKDCWGFSKPWHLNLIMPKLEDPKQRLFYQIPFYKTLLTSVWGRYFLLLFPHSNFYYRKTNLQLSSDKALKQYELDPREGGVWLSARMMFSKLCLQCGLRCDLVTFGLYHHRSVKAPVHVHRRWQGERNPGAVADVGVAQESMRVKQPKRGEMFWEKTSVRNQVGRETGEREREKNRSLGNKIYNH